MALTPDPLSLPLSLPRGQAIGEGVFGVALGAVAHEVKLT